jgi:hypothetical protein
VHLVVRPCFQIPVWISLVHFRFRVADDGSGPEFVSPTAIRSAIRREKGKKYNMRKDAQLESSKRREGRKRNEDELAVSKVFS